MKDNLWIWTIGECRYVCFIPLFLPLRFPSPSVTCTVLPLSILFFSLVSLFLSICSLYLLLPKSKLTLPRSHTGCMTTAIRQPFLPAAVRTSSHRFTVPTRFIERNRYAAADRHVHALRESVREQGGTSSADHVPGELSMPFPSLSGTLF